MKKVVASIAFIALAGTASAANFLGGGVPGTGVFNSKHDMNTVVGLTKDSQGRVCAFCHTPHHAEVVPGYNPLWSHTPTGLAGVTAYSSPTFDGGDGLVDPLQGPSRLCMSCHDGVVAPDQHYGNLFTGLDMTAQPAGSHFVADTFGNIAVGKGGDFGNDHPIGFDVVPVIAADPGIYNDLLTAKKWLLSGAQGTVDIKKAFFDVNRDGSVMVMTCATCHDVHNKDNVKNDATTAIGDATHLVGSQNYFVYAPVNGSQICLSCHDK